MMAQGVFKQFYGKIMLFGEYSVITGSSAYLIPYKRVYAHLNFPEAVINKNSIADSNLSLRKFAGFLSRAANDNKTKVPIDIPRLITDLEKGLYLYSTIPPNYGLGSSGALCASVYEEYRIDPDKHDFVNTSGKLKDLKEVFSGMESFFHGFSSGVDPLCIYTNSAVVIDTDGIPAIVDAQEDNFSGLYPFLINTHHRSHTGPLVASFRSQMNSPAKRDDFISHYVPCVNKAVKQLITGKLNLDTVLEISAGQMNFFKQMIPESLREIWKKGIETGLYACKLCGSGGGGMVLGFTRDLAGTRNYMRDNYHLYIEAISEN